MKKIFINIIRFDKKYRSYILFFLSFLLYTQLYSPLIENIIVNNIAPYLKFANSYWGDFVFGTFLISSLIAIIVKVKISLWKRNPKFDDAIIPIIIFSMYILHRFNILQNSSWYFLSFKSFSFMKYSDGPILLSLFLIYNPKRHLKERKKFEGIPELYEDNFNQKNGGIDLFKRSEYAKYISKLIHNMNPASSFAIGIRGSWGSGKSVFLNKIDREIFHVIKIRFNPWLSKTTDEVLADFFKILVDRTSEYDSRLSKSFRNYYSSLINLDESFFKSFFSSINIIKSNKETSLEKQQKEIIGRLNENSLKIVIFIDDLDRLNADEILSVLKLIRNSFNFPNTFFLVAYDDKYIRNTLRKRIDNPEKFLEKIFQLDIDLPSFPLDLVQKQLIELLEINKTDAQKNKISEAVRIIGESQVLSDTIKNLRDAIRFANSFNHIYQKKEIEVDHFDFILLELLKIKNRTIYNEVRTSLISYSTIDYIQQPESLFTENESIKFVPTKKLNEKHPEYSLLTMLFNRTNNFDEVKTIRLAGNSIRYFSDDLFGIISYTEFEKYKDNSFAGFKTLIDNQNAKNNIDELANKILRINLFTDQSSFFNLNKALLYICDLKNDYSYTTPVHSNLKANYSKLKTLIPDNNDFSKYIETLFSSDDYDALAESQVLGDILSTALEQNKQTDSPDFDFNLTKNILIKNLKQFISNHPDAFNKLVFDIYYKIIESKDPDQVIISAEANSILKEYIINNQSTYFKEWLLRPKYSGNFNLDMYVLEPFIDQYLKYPEFERLLYEQQSSLEILRLQGFFRKYKMNDYKEAEYSPLTIEIISDPHTVFVGSLDFPEHVTRKSIIRPDKLAGYSNRHIILSYANWIAHAEKLSVDEQEKGGTYRFKKEFNLIGLVKNIKTAKIYFLVDDFLRLEINSKKIDEEFEGFDKPPNEIDLIDYINKGINELFFDIRNVSYKKEILEKAPDANPYDFIYKIIIEFED